MRGLLPLGGKIDRFLLVLPLKEVRIWIVRHLPSPRPCLQAGYWVDGDDDDDFKVISDYFKSIKVILLKL